MKFISTMIIIRQDFKLSISSIFLQQEINMLLVEVNANFSYGPLKMLLFVLNLGKRILPILLSNRYSLFNIFSKLNLYQQFCRKQCTVIHFCRNSVTQCISTGFRIGKCYYRRGGNDARKSCLYGSSSTCDLFMPLC